MRTLKSLRLLPNGNMRIFLGSLDEFKYLESLETDFRLLFGDPGSILFRPSSNAAFVNYGSQAPRGRCYRCSILRDPNGRPQGLKEVLSWSGDLYVERCIYIDTIVPLYRALVSELGEMGVEFSFFQHRSACEVGITVAIGLRSGKSGRD